jgi:hypothetical protein
VPETGGTVFELLSVCSEQLAEYANKKIDNIVKSIFFIPHLDIHNLINTLSKSFKKISILNFITTPGATIALSLSAFGVISRNKAEKGENRSVCEG